MDRFVRFGKYSQFGKLKKFWGSPKPLPPNTQGCKFHVKEMLYFVTIFNPHVTDRNKIKRSSCLKCLQPQFWAIGGAYFDSPRGAVMQKINVISVYHLNLLRVQYHRCQQLSNGF